jgi:uncharacterized protein
MTEATMNNPWYRHRWPWLLMIMPSIAIVGGFFTWWLAATANNSLVVDDYYREGRAINQQLARDDRAAKLGLSASLTQRISPAAPTAPGVVLRLSSTQGATELPDWLSLRLVHATESALDAALRLTHQGNGRYEGAGILPASGNWIVQLEDPTRDWRLVARTDRFDAPVALRSDPSLAGGGR